MLQTNLKHINSANEFKDLIESNENVMVCCGRMGPMCVPVLKTMEFIEKDYPSIKFADMEFDNPDSYVIKDAPECSGFMGLPFTVYYKNGKMVKATSSIQSKEQIEEAIGSSLLNNN